jgi:cytochrome c oxidase assembly protein subunit 15
MNGQVIPNGIIAKDKPFWKNFFENVPMVQFNHRTMAYITMSISYHLLYKILKARIGGPFTVAGLLAVFMINYQAFSGIMVLLNLVPRQKANVHQMTAVITITSVLLMVYLARVPLPPI